MGEKEKEHKQKPISLLKLVTLGVTSSILVVGGLFLLFAAYESQTWLFWTAKERLDPDTLFGVGRNAVTLAAALGVGVTLFFSYRKQQTSEKAQELASQAQENAVKALQLSLEKHDLETVSEMRNRYSRSAEQLASDKASIQFAGLYSLVALADDWAARRNTDEQQVCISLIGSHTRSVGPSSSADQRMTASRASVVLMSRLKSELLGTLRSWSDRDIDLFGVQLGFNLDRVTISGGNTYLHNCHFSTIQGIRGLNLTGGSLQVRSSDDETSLPQMMMCHLDKGYLSLSKETSTSKVSISITRTFFSGTKAHIFLNSDLIAEVMFDECTFEAGRLDIFANSPVARFIFIKCIFTSPDVVAIYESLPTNNQFDFTGSTFSGDASGMADDPRQAITRTRPVRSPSPQRS